VYVKVGRRQKKVHSSGAIFIANHVADAIRAAAVPVEMDVLLRDHLLLSAQYVLWPALPTCVRRRSETRTTRPA
jgi:hypothetical protein